MKNIVIPQSTGHILDRDIRRANERIKEAETMIETAKKAINTKGVSKEGVLELENQIRKNEANVKKEKNEIESLNNRIKKLGYIYHDSKRDSAAAIRSIQTEIENLDKKIAGTQDEIKALEKLSKHRNKETKRLQKERDEAHSTLNNLRDELNDKLGKKREIDENIMKGKDAEKRIAVIDEYNRLLSLFAKGLGTVLAVLTTWLFAKPILKKVLTK